MTHRSILASAFLAIAASAFAQTTPPTVTLPTVIVTAQKEATDIKDVPASVTAVTAQTITDSGLRAITDAAIFAPNTVFTEFTARKVSNARFRGIGSSPNNPAITTYIDGVPQLNSNSSNIELLDVSQIEFVRGPQSPLFGRNTLGGIVNVVTARPSMSEWNGTAFAPFGNAGLMEVRGNVSGPVGDKAAVGFAGGHQQRDGYTVNAITGNDLDFRDGTFAKAQFMVLPNANWETRFIYAHERNRDGDYALGDLDAIRLTPHRVARDFEGFTNRDINSATFNVRGTGQNFAITSNTGFVKWNTEDATDLDYSPLPLATRINEEADRQFTQEIRIGSPANAPMAVTDQLMLRWQAGIEYFNQAYEQDAVNTLSAFVLDPRVPFPVAMTSPEASIDSAGIGLFARGTLTINDKTDVTAGLRFDHESSDAVLRTSFEPAIQPANVVTAEQSFSDVSPQFAVAYRVTPEHNVYASAARGYKAGGYNPAALPGSEAYGEEHAWHVEAGVKSSIAGGKVAASAAVFFIDWDDLQLNVPNPFVPGQFYITNVGGASSSGIEFDVTARPHQMVDVFASFGYTNASFADGTRRWALTSRGTTCRSRRTTPRCLARSSIVRSPRRSTPSSVAKPCCRERSSMTKPTRAGRRRIRSSTSAPARAASTCLARSGCATPSRRGMCRLRFPTSLRSRGSSARMAGLVPSASVSESHSDDHHHADLARLDRNQLAGAGARPGGDHRDRHRAGSVVPQCRHQLAASGAVHRRRVRGRGALSRRVRVHVGLAGVHRRSARRGLARADADAGHHVRGVFPVAGVGIGVRPDRARLDFADWRGRGRRGVHLRSRHAARRRLRVGNALQRRRRQHPHADHAVLLHHRLGDRHGAHGVVGGAAGLARDLGGDHDGSLGGAGREPDPVWRHRVVHDVRGEEASRTTRR